MAQSQPFDVPVPTLPKIKMGQFDPGNAGGINQGREFENKKVQNNPWDFILMFEGTLLFASALVRRSPGRHLSGFCPVQRDFPVRRVCLV